MTSVAILYFSGYGHTHKLAEAVGEGVTRGGAQPAMLRIGDDGEIDEAGWTTLAAADAIIFGSPTYMGGPAWQFKKVADASSKPWFGQAWKDKVAAGFTNSATVNGDKGATLLYFWTLAMQHGTIWVGTGLLPANKKDNGPADINWTGGSGGAMAISPSDASAEEAPRGGDLETARLLGERVAALAAKLEA